MRQALAFYIFPLPPTLNDQIRLAHTHWTKSASKKKLWTNKIARMCKGKPVFISNLLVLKQQTAFHHICAQTIADAQILISATVEAHAC